MMNAGHVDAFRETSPEPIDCNPSLRRADDDACGIAPGWQCRSGRWARRAGARQEQGGGNRGGRHLDRHLEERLAADGDDVQQKVIITMRPGTKSRPERTAQPGPPRRQGLRSSTASPARRIMQAADAAGRPDVLSVSADADVSSMATVGTVYTVSNTLNTGAGSLRVRRSLMPTRTSAPTPSCSPWRAAVFVTITLCVGAAGHHQPGHHRRLDDSWLCRLAPSS